MESMPDKQSRFENGVLVTLFLVFQYLYLWIKVEPQYYFMKQQPAFYFLQDFLSQYTRYPGGLLQAISAFVSQSYLIPAAAALILTLTGLSVIIGTRAWLNRAGRSRFYDILQFIPAIFLLMLQSQYNYALAETLGVMFAFLVFLWLNRLPIHSLSLRIVVHVFVLVLFYAICGGAVYFLTLLCLFSEFQAQSGSSRKWFVKVLPAAVCLGCVSVLPLIPISGFMVAPLRERFFNNLFFSTDYQPFWLSYVFYGFYPIILLLIVLIRRISRSKKWTSIRSYRSAWMQIRFRRLWEFVILCVLIISMASIPLFATRDGSKKTNLVIQTLAHERQWNRLLETVRKEKPNNPFATVEMNRALYHTGSLLDSLFCYTQDWGSNGLFIPQEYGYVSPLQISDLFLDMGHVTEALHWAYEAEAVFENSPWNFQQLAVTHLLKRNTAAAGRYLFYLKHSPLFRKWAFHYQDYLEDPGLMINDPIMRQTYNWMPLSDFIVHSALPQDDLEALLQNNTGNKMAFEYLMAHCLLTRDLKTLEMHKNDLIRFEYSHIPRHVEEALLLYYASNRKQSVTIRGYQIRQSTLQRFQEYMQLTYEYRQNQQLLPQILYREFGQTYWYYHAFHQEREKEELNIPALTRSKRKK